MTMNAATLKTAIVDNIKARPGYNNFNDGSMNLIIEAICEEVVSHIQNNAQVSTTVNTIVTGTLPSGPQAAAGTGTGTGSVS